MSIGAARQADFVTMNDTDGDFRYGDILIADPPPMERKIQDFDPSHSQIGGHSPRLPGSKHGGTFTMRFPMRSCNKSGYDGGAGAGGADALGTGDDLISLEMLLLATAWGSAGVGAIANAADWSEGKHLYVDAGAQNGVTGGTTSTAEVADATAYKEGQMWVSMAGSSDDTVAVAWIKDATAGTTVTFSEAVEAAATPINTDDIYDTAVAVVRETDRSPLTIRLMGNNAGFKFAMVGCTAVETRHTLGAGDLWWCEIDWTYTDRNDFSSGGGLQIPDAYYPVPALLGDDGGRMVWGAQGSATEASALGWRDLELKVTWPIHAIMDVNAAEGVGEVVNTIPVIELTAKIPTASGDTVTGGEDEYETILSTEARKTFQWASGTAYGQIGSMYLPQMQLKSAPQREVIEEVEYYSMTWEPGGTTNDTGTDEPANRLVRFGIA